MGKIAFVFSGQGAQKAGMGKDFYEKNETVKALFDGAEEIREGTLTQCFEGKAEELKDTQNTQPCLYLADLAAAITVLEAGIMPNTKKFLERGAAQLDYEMIGGQPTVTPPIYFLFKISITSLTFFTQ